MAKNEARKKENTLKLYKCPAEKFKAAITEDKADSFAKTFVAKANMQKQWDHCVGAWDDNDELMGAIIVTVSKHKPKIANLQLLHTFAKHRRKGVGSALCIYGLRQCILEGHAQYFRVSIQPNAVPFYESLGMIMIGRQKSGSKLSMFRISGFDYREGIYDINDHIIRKAALKRGETGNPLKGSCVEIYQELQQVSLPQ
jgi:GNAT superfamily N-acetyltransferase